MKYKNLQLTVLLFYFISLVTSTAAQQGWGIRNPLPQGSVYQLDFLNINTGYGVCERGLVLKTTNGGTTWLFLRSHTGKNLYSLHFFNINTGYTVGDSGIILYTTNSGVNWTVRNSGVNDALKSITFVNQSTGFAAGINGKVLKTTNNGLNWQVLSLGSYHLNEIRFLNENTGFIAGSGGLFAKTTNAGLNWITKNIDTSAIRSVYFTSADTGYLSCNRSIFRTIDGGFNWVNVCTLYYYNSDVYSLSFVNSQTGYCVGKNLPILKTVNAGLNWMMEVTGVYEPYIYYDICLIDTIRYISGTDGYILKSSANTEWRTIGGTKHPINSISLAGYNNIVGAANNQTLLSTNGGLNWKVDTYGGNNFFEPFYTIFKKVKFNRSNNGYIISKTGGGGTGVYWESIAHSTNGGVTWEGPGGWYGGWFTDIHDVEAIENVGIMVGRTLQGGFIKRQESGSNWVTQYSSPTQIYYDVSFADANTGIVRGSYSVQFILRTTNAGLNWNEYTLQPNFYGKMQLITPETALCITTSRIIYRSTNGGINWTVQDTGFAAIGDFEFVNAYKGWAVGGSGLILYTTDGGYNWSQQQSNTTNGLLAVSFIDELNGVIGGDAGTVLKTTNGGITYINITTDPVPNSYSLKQNYPNPFNPVTTITFDLPKKSHVILSIFDVNGRELAKPIDEILNQGSHKLLWNGENYSSGVYFYRIETEDFTETKKMVLIK